jgi:hypothetical protein
MHQPLTLEELDSLKPFLEEIEVDQVSMSLSLFALLLTSRRNKLARDRGKYF